MKRIIFIALTALALGLASVGGGAPAIAGGVSGGVLRDGGQAAPAMAGGLSGGVLRDGGSPSGSDVLAGRAAGASGTNF